MERKITLQISSQYEIDELLAALKIRIHQTQNLMKKNKGKPWILNALDYNRRAQENLISEIKSRL